jgi:hypothetical protein
MAVTIADLRAAGCSDTEIVRILGEAEARSRELSRLKQRRYRENVKAKQNQQARYVDNVTAPPLSQTLSPPWRDLSMRKDTESAREKKPLVVLPEDWAPKAAHHALARQLFGWDEWKTYEEAEHFRDKARAKDYRYADWDAAFRNWLKSPYQQQKGSTNGNGRRYGSILDASDRLDQKLDPEGTVGEYTPRTTEVDKFAGSNGARRLSKG